MDALKLFYDSKFGPPPGRAPERVSSAARRADAEASEKLLRRVEAHAGRPLRTGEAIDAYFKAASKPRRESRPAGRSLLRETVLVMFLLVAVLQYYYMDVALQIAALNQVTVFVPTEEPAPRADIEKPVPRADAS